MLLECIHIQPNVICASVCRDRERVPRFVNITLRDIHEDPGRRSSNETGGRLERYAIFSNNVQHSRNVFVEPFVESACQEIYGRLFVELCHL